MNFPKFPVRQRTQRHKTLWNTTPGDCRGSPRQPDGGGHRIAGRRGLIEHVTRSHMNPAHADASCELHNMQTSSCDESSGEGVSVSDDEDLTTAKPQISNTAMSCFFSTVVEKVSSLTGHKRLLYLQITQELALSLVVHLSWWKWVICFAFSSYGCTQLYYSYISKLHLKAESHSMCVVVGMVYTPVVYVYWWYLCLLLFMFTHFTCALNMSLFSALSQLVVMFQIVFGKHKTVISLYQCTLWVCLRLNTTVFVSESLLSNGAR